MPILINDTGRTGGEQTVVRNSQEAWPSLLLTFSKVSWRLLCSQAPAHSRFKQSCAKILFYHAQGYHADLLRSV
jgi:hypothetical protein